MDPLRRNPHIYQINLMTWLRDLSSELGRRVTLETIPGDRWPALRELGMDLVWLMGMWERSPTSREKARREPNLLEAGRNALPDFEVEDLDGSPYAVHDYRPDPRFGSEEALLAVKEACEAVGLRLILDFVPNHTACDHQWVLEKPEIYVHKETAEDPVDGFFRVQGQPYLVANGKDPYFPPWTDTAQLHYGRKETHQVMARALLGLTRFCHGFRCDMAMLVLRDIFRNTWGALVGDPETQEEFWDLARRAFKAEGVSPLMIAEAYWGTDARLRDLGFQFVYDKELYDLFSARDIARLRELLARPAAEQEHQVRFLENHDEPRAMAFLGPGHIRCAMVLHATLPGMRFWQEGQFEGYRIRVPVQLSRAPREEADPDLLRFSHVLLRLVDHPVFHDGAWELCETAGWHDNDSHRHLLAWSWRLGQERRWIVGNLSDQGAQGRVIPPSGWLPRARALWLSDPLKGERFQRERAKTETHGLYVGLGPGEFHFFTVEGRIER
ncbi:MAG: alpha-amylase [Deltaproteobacteria bacterium]|nr:alpha-amylase [Deltaproteobacteria bacterium]MBW1923477.1 alpha-amylase [Deltaproteobacteria bacterium]MBW1948670.1 alpha-amylase [Deltaproteobacteria bacterium]MBW2007228.1 alpha-amylase [Deltaproteobacteria bacterium]MBW2101597.1 alpha-amylase [Deltaproteobacteria bacterium]